MSWPTCWKFRAPNPFRIRAYRNASRTLEGLTDSVASLLESGADLTELQGIGKDLAGKIKQLVETGTLEQLEETQKRKCLPASLT